MTNMALNPQICRICSGSGKRMGLGMMPVECECAKTGGVETVVQQTKLLDVQIVEVKPLPLSVPPLTTTDESMQPVRVEFKKKRGRPRKKK